MCTTPAPGTIAARAHTRRLPRSLQRKHNRFSTTYTLPFISAVFRADHCSRFSAVDHIRIITCARHCCRRRRMHLRFSVKCCSAISCSISMFLVPLARDFSFVSKMGEDSQPDVSITSASTIDWPVLHFTASHFASSSAAAMITCLTVITTTFAAHVGASEGGESHWTDLKFEILIEMEINKRNDLPKQFLCLKRPLVNSLRSGGREAESLARYRYRAGVRSARIRQNGACSRFDSPRFYHLVQVNIVAAQNYYVFIDRMCSPLGSGHSRAFDKAVFASFCLLFCIGKMNGFA